MYAGAHIEMSAEVNGLRRKEQRQFRPMQDQIKNIAEKYAVTWLRFHQQLKARLDSRIIVWLWTSKRRSLGHGNTLETGKKLA
jgi:hypothetical protein